jgi:hypothetical protein
VLGKVKNGGITAAVNIRNSLQKIVTMTVSAYVTAEVELKHEQLSKN